MKNYIREIRKIQNIINQFLLKENDISIISSNCNGGCIAHDLHLKYYSPFVNLWIYPKDFIKILNNFEHYMQQELVFISKVDISYPVAILGDVEIYFQHYKSEDEAKRKWEERKARINFNKCFIIMTDRDGCSYKDLVEFEDVPFQNKVVFTNKKYETLKSTYYIKGFESNSSVGICSEYAGKLTWKKWYDQFNYVSWFNQRSEKSTKQNIDLMKAGDDDAK